MGRRIGKIAVLGAAALVLGLIAAPGASAAPPATCLNLSTFLPPDQVDQPVATIVGTNGSDVLRGTSGPDVIAGLDGNDIIAGLGGDDIICGGRGNDKIDGGPGADSILGDTGESFLLGNPAGMNVPGGNDLLSGGDGDDLIGGEGGRDLILAGAGNDFATGQMAEDIVSGGSGDDELFGGPANDLVKGEDGNDFLVGNFGNDLLLGAAATTASLATHSVHRSHPRSTSVSASRAPTWPSQIPASGKSRSRVTSRSTAEDHAGPPAAELAVPRRAAAAVLARRGSGHDASGSTSRRLSRLPAPLALGGRW